jgi:hypothetical protein
MFLLLCNTPLSGPKRIVGEAAGRDKPALQPSAAGGQAPADQGICISWLLLGEIMKSFLVSAMIFGVTVPGALAQSTQRRLQRKRLISVVRR